MTKHVAFNDKPQTKEFYLGSEELAHKKGWSRTLNWLGVFLIVLFSILSFGTYLIACAIRGKWLLPKSGYSKPKYNLAKAPGSAYPHNANKRPKTTEASTTNNDLQVEQIVEPLTDPLPISLVPGVPGVPGVPAEGSKV